MTGVKRSMMAAAGSAGGEGEYVEDVFSTYLYDGNQSSGHTITTGIDLAGEGGLIWSKRRNASSEHGLFDSERDDFEHKLEANTDDAESNYGAHIQVTSTGYTIDTTGYGETNNEDGTYVNWTFRKAPGFFDVVAYTGDGTSDRELSHDLGSTPGFILIKSLEQDGVSWAVYHTSLGVGKELILNSNSAATSYADLWVSVSATTFNVQSNSKVNTDTEPYIAYLFANDAQVFGADGDESIIKCGIYTGNDSTDGPEIDLGWEPQWLMLKGVGGSDWLMADIIRGLPVGEDGARLNANLDNAEYINNEFAAQQASGFQLTNSSFFNTSPNTYIYVAIRRPMKVPEAGTEVFDLVKRSGSSSVATLTTSNRPDMVISKGHNLGGTHGMLADRLRGTSVWLRTKGDDAEVSMTDSITAFNNKSITLGADGGTYEINKNYFYSTYFFTRAPEFMDIVCYDGFSSPNPKALSHNLTVAPEMIIIKRRNGAQDWYVWSEALGVPDTPAGYMQLNTDVASSTGEDQIKAVAATTFSLKANENRTSAAGNTYIAYLFATLEGISKVGSYTADASLTTIDCGFAAGARFVLIKRTDATGDWYLFDTGQGIVAGNDPYLRPNLTNNQVTGTDYIDPHNDGFQITAAGSSTINVDTGEYIFLAIA